MNTKKRKIIMKQLGSNDKMVRFFKILAAVILAFEILTDCFPSVGVYSIFPMVIDGMTLCLVLAGLFFRQIKKAIWAGLLFCGFVSILFAPLELTGTLLILFGMYIQCFDGRYNSRSLIKTIVIGIGVISFQIWSMFINPGLFLNIPVHTVLIDFLLCFLICINLDSFVKDPRKSEELCILHPILILNDYGLTSREIQIVHLIWGGQTPKEIASDLKLSESTIRKNLTDIYKKLKIGGTPELIVLGHTHQIVFAQDKMVQTET